MQTAKIDTSWGLSRAGSLTPLCPRHVSTSPSLPQRGRHRDDRRCVVVERVIRETMTATVQYPMLTRSNNNEWALLMRVNLQAQGLWHALELEKGETIEYREDRLAFAAILRSVPPEMLASHSTKRTAQSPRRESNIEQPAEGALGDPL